MIYKVDSCMHQCTSHVMRQVRNSLLSPTTTALLRKGSSLLILVSMGTGCIFALWPPDIVIESEGERWEEIWVRARKGRGGGYPSLCSEQKSKNESPMMQYPYPSFCQWHTRIHPTVKVVKINIYWYPTVNFDMKPSINSLVDDACILLHCSKHAD